MKLKEILKKVTEKKQPKYQSVPVRNFYNSILTADVFEKQRFYNNV